MSKRWVILIIISIVILFVFSIIGPIMSDVEQPKYKVLLSDKIIEIREYQPIIIAEVKIIGERKEAIKIGFKLLADYIFGNNQIKEKIEMTAPVQQQHNKVISMTKPVMQQKHDSAWKVNFVMPSKYTIETLPKPNNRDINIKELPNKKYIVIKFSGSNSDDNIVKNEIEIKKYISQNHIKSIAEPIYAFYNPPWTLPFLRRNEIMIEIEK